MNIICASCKDKLGEKEPFDEDSAFYAVCLKCKDKVLKKALESKTEKMNSKEKSVVLGQ